MKIRLDHQTLQATTTLTLEPLPFASLDGATMLLIQDHTPPTAGQKGQIIAFTHDPDCMDYVAPDMQTFLRQSLAALRADPQEFFLEE